MTHSNRPCRRCITFTLLLSIPGYVEHVHKPENIVHIVHGHEVEYPAGEFFPDYVVPRKYPDQAIRELSFI